MAILEIVHFPDERLRVDTRPLESFGAETQQLIDDMFETMYDAPGVGLAATQVGLDVCIAVMDCSDEKNQPIVMANPEIISLDEEIEVDEGCLSVPGHYDRLRRYRRATIRAQDRDGNSYELEGSDLLAQCMQHEIDHLRGKLYIDYLSELKRSRIRRKLEKERRFSSRQA